MTAEKTIEWGKTEETMHLKKFVVLPPDAEGDMQEVEKVSAEVPQVIHMQPKPAPKPKKAQDVQVISRPLDGIDVFISYGLPVVVFFVFIGLGFKFIEGIGSVIEDAGAMVGKGILSLANILLKAVLVAISGMVVFWVFRFLFQRKRSTLDEVQLPSTYHPSASANTSGNPINIQVNQYNY